MAIKVEVQGVEPERLYTMQEVADLLNRSRNWLYQEVYKDRLRTADVGSSRARLVEGQEVINYVHERILKLRH